MTIRNAVSVVVLSAGLVGLTAASLSGQGETHKPTSTSGQATTPGPAGAAKPASGAPAGPATPAASPQPNVRAVVARIQERIAAEVASGNKNTAGGASGSGTGPSPRSTAATGHAPTGASARQNRIRLEWRVTLDWPADLRE